MGALPRLHLKLLALSQFLYVCVFYAFAVIVCIVFFSCFFLYVVFACVEILMKFAYKLRLALGVVQLLYSNQGDVAQNPHGLHSLDQPPTPPSPLARAGTKGEG